MSLMDKMLGSMPLETMAEHINAENTANTGVAIETSNPYARDILFVATNLDSWEADDIRYGYEVMLDVCYRQLDACYYAWLRDKMTQVKSAYEAGKIKPEIYDELRARFNTIQSWAISHIGEQALLRAIKSFKSGIYVPPSEVTFKEYRKREPIPGMPAAGENLNDYKAAELDSPAYLFPKDGEWTHSIDVPRDALGKVNAIRDKALKLGWSESSLFQNRGRYPFPYGSDYGLICFLTAGRTIGEVTERFIDILGKSEKNRFYNPHADQPWLIRVA